MILSADTNDSCLVRAYRDDEGNIAIRTTRIGVSEDYSENTECSVKTVIVPAADLADLIDALQHLDEDSSTDKGQCQEKHR